MLFSSSSSPSPPSPVIFSPPLNKTQSLRMNFLKPTHLFHFSKCKNIQTLKQLHSQIIKTGLHNFQFTLSRLIEFCAVSSPSNGGDLS
ncbi:hypothetical protein MKW92_006843, partial [Papaver armeniacum]